MSFLMRIIDWPGRVLRWLGRCLAFERGDGGQARAERRHLAARMRSVRAVLRKLGPGGRQPLPWYLLIGAPGSGKTTVLAHSGLHFPLGDAAQTRGCDTLAGTRQCDWWFTDEAVLLDTTGRYVSQAGETDQRAWHALLEQLRKHRRRSPVCGVIVTLGVSDLLQLDDAGRAGQAKAVRARIEALHGHLGRVLPVYLMVTQCDRLAGFCEFFECLGQAQRGQVWGMTFAMGSAEPAAGALASFATEFDALERQLQVRVLERLQQERNLCRRALLYRFPQQFAGIKAMLGDYLQHVFEPNRYQSALMLRGVYFTSSQAAGRSYFVSRLLREVIFAEAGATGADWRLEQRRWLRAGKLRVLLLTLLLAVGMGFGFRHNLSLVEWSEQYTAQMQRLIQLVCHERDVPGVLPLLDQARGLAAIHSEHGKHLERVALNPDSQRERAAQALYRRLLRSTLLEQIVADLESTLRRGDANDQHWLFETLRAYLMLGERQFFDAASLQAWVDVAWRDAWPQVSEQQRQALSVHVSALLDDKDALAVPLDAELIARTRLTLAKLPVPHRVYNRLTRQLAQRGFAELSVNAAAGRDASSLLRRRSGAPLSRGVSGVYSVAGYRALLASSEQAVLDMAGEGWVLDRQEAMLGMNGVEDINGAVLSLYYADYIQHWDAYLADVQPVALNTLDQAARVSHALNAADSPLRAFLQAAARETSLEGADPESASHPVDRHFAALHTLVGRDPPSPLDEGLALLSEASQFFDGAQRARRSGMPAPSDEVLGRIQRAAGDQPAPLSSILLEVGENGSLLALGNERERLNALWRAGGATFCREAIEGRYPLVREASAEISADDFGKFFGPGGLLDDFFNKQLAPYVDMSSSRWRWRATSNIPQAVLDQFQHGLRLRDMFFVGGAQQPSLRFGLKPIGADPELAMVTLDIAGQPVVFEPGSRPGFTPIVLPSGKGSDLVQLHAGLGLRSEGPWAWLRLVDQGRLSGEQGKRFELSFDLDGRQVRYALLANSVINPFNRDSLEQFRCPVRL
ncbi:type VI secretion system membrane subunit TssM [Pseudomonas sp. NPDC089401]|uniref:type VI secretion system membrane subunit TssM n=1 Tax=Pseudomonas sp. NPDC089401 TaxID=3364462 RepID=UPI0037FE1879